jgi:hypothetical protein
MDNERADCQVRGRAVKTDWRNFGVGLPALITKTPCGLGPMPIARGGFELGSGDYRGIMANVHPNHRIRVNDSGGKKVADITTQGVEGLPVSD